MAQEGGDQVAGRGRRAGEIDVPGNRAGEKRRAGQKPGKALLEQVFRLAPEVVKDVFRQASFFHPMPEAGSIEVLGQGDGRNAGDIGFQAGADGSGREGEPDARIETDIDSGHDQVRLFLLVEVVNAPVDAVRRSPVQALGSVSEELDFVSVEVAEAGDRFACPALLFFGNDNPQGAEAGKLAGDKFEKGERWLSSFVSNMSMLFNSKGIRTFRIRL